jgi:hypothetical protein
MEDTYITTFSAKEVADMPLGTTSNNHFSFNRSLAAFAPGAEQFMKVKVTVKPH